MKVLLINNYPMDHAWDLWQRGEYPGHHLWGATHLAKHNIEVEIFPYQTSNLNKILNKIGRKLGLGDQIDQQLRILFSRTDYDVIYSACQTNTFLLALLRSLHLCRKPLVALLHHPLNNTFKDALFVNGHDRLLCLSKTAMQAFVSQPNLYKKMDLLEWGADLSFYKLKSNDLEVSDSPFFVSAGKTERDHDTLVKAFLTIDCPLKIYCSATTAPGITPLPAHIEITASHSSHNAVSYQEILVTYRRAFAIAIPLTKTNNLAGLTSLLDAMAVGKPVIMTRNKYIDLDIEKEGIGLWVEPDDVAGWQQAIAYLLANPDEALAMGDRGRRLCETKYNLDVFTNTLARTLKNIPV